jgi:hypothetical protein
MIMAASAILGTIITFISTRGRTRSDAKTSLDSRIDARVEKQLQTAWEQIDKQASQITGLKGQNKQQARQIAELRAHASIAEMREVLIYKHTRALRDHILRELPPPPPAMPPELIEWFERFGDTQPPTGPIETV